MMQIEKTVDTIDNMARVVMVEDNPDDIIFTRMFMRRQRITIDVTFFRNGEECVDHLVAGVNSGDPKKPDLILLDLSLPRMNGREVLAFIKTNEKLVDIPVVMLSGSDAHEDIAETAQLGAAYYMVKPIAVDSLNTMITVIKNMQFIEVDTCKYLVKIT